MVLPPARDLYFQGLLSQKLGADRLVDDELALLIVEDRDFAALCTEYSGGTGAGNGAAKRVAAKAKLLAIDGADSEPQHRWAVWTAVLEDPRFDLVWKRALDQLREPLPVVRNSLVGRVLAFLSKFKAPGSSPSVLPLVLGTVAATTAIWGAPGALHLAKGAVGFGQEPPLQPPSLDLTAIKLQLAAVNDNLERLANTAAACMQCRASASLPTQGANSDQFVKALQQASIAVHDEVDSAVQVTRQNSSAVEKLTVSVQGLPDKLNGLLNSDTPVNQVWQKIQVNTATTIEALKEYPASKVGVGASTAKDGSSKTEGISQPFYINKTLAESRAITESIRTGQVESADLRAALSGSRFTIDSLEKGAYFLLRETVSTNCVEFQVLQQDWDSVLLKYKPLNSCTAASKALPTQWFKGEPNEGTIRVSTEPRLVFGKGSSGLYLSLKRTRTVGMAPPIGRRAFLAVYSKSDWDLP
jgi:hypothetical protein